MKKQTLTNILSGAICAFGTFMIAYGFYGLFVNMLVVILALLSVAYIFIGAVLVIVWWPEPKKQCSRSSSSHSCPCSCSQKDTEKIDIAQHEQTK